MWTVAFWKDLAERALATFAEALVAALVVVEGGIVDVDWGQGLGVAALAALVAVLKGIVGIKLGEAGTAGWVDVSGESTGE